MDRHLVSRLVICLMALAAPCAAQVTPQDFRDIDEAALRNELVALCKAVFEEDLSAVHVAQWVDHAWTLNGVDAVMARIVDDAVAYIKQDTTYWERLKSNWSKGKAKAMAERVSEIVFSSPEFQELMGTIADEVSEKAVARLQFVSEKAASESIHAIAEFLGASYSEAFMPMFEAELAAIALEPVDITPEVSGPIGQNPNAAAGVAVIVGAQVARVLASRLARRVGKSVIGRIVGRVTARVASMAVPVAGWIVGGGLIVWDLVAGAEGALPQIGKVLKREETMAMIRRDIAEKVHDELVVSSPEIARDVAGEVYSIWLDLKAKMPRVFELAKEHEGFRRDILENTQRDDFYALAQLTDVCWNAVGKPALIELIDQGHFASLQRLPVKSYEIIRVTKSPRTLLDWAELAGSGLLDVALHEVYQYKAPRDFDRDGLRRLLALEDHEAMVKLLALDNETIETLFTMPRASLAALANSLTPDQLRTLTWHLDQGPPPLANALIRILLDRPHAASRLEEEKLKRIFRDNGQPQQVLDYFDERKGFAGMVSGVMDTISGERTVGSLVEKFWLELAATLAAIIAVFYLVNKFSIWRLSKKLLGKK